MTTELTHRHRSRHETDEGAILPLVLVVVVVMSLVIVALADYSSTGLRYGQVVERSNQRLAAAEGAIDVTIESIERRASECTMTTLANGAAHTVPIDVEINGIEAEVTCTTTGVTAIEEFALVLTGAPFTTDALIQFPLGGTGDQQKVIDGPIFAGERPPPFTSNRFFLSNDLTVRNGDVWYETNGSCPTLPSRLQVATDGYGIRCIDHDWTTLFGSSQPPIPSFFGLPLNPPPNLIDGCWVWQPGRYTIAPFVEDDEYHYFRSGNYVFDDFPFDVEDAWVLFGAPGPAGPSLARLPSEPHAPNPCQGQWANDPDQGGATLYLDDAGRFEVQGQGAVEVSGRLQAGRRVAVQALPTSSLITNIPRVVKASTGDPQIAIRGMLWAPRGSVELNRISNPDVPAIDGGAVLAEIHLGAPATKTNVLVRAPSTPAPRRVEIVATVDSPAGGTTTVRAVVDYRDGRVGVVERRVLCLAGEC